MLTRATVAAVLLSLAAAAGADGALAQYDFAKGNMEQWKLPKKLREISGLAETGGRLYTHDDQSGIVYEIDYDQARLKKAFALGKPTVRDDFEGIAIADGRFYLVSSAGMLYEFDEADNGERVGYRRYPTGLGKRCELEGLAFDDATDNLLLACKEARVDELEQIVTVFAWSVVERTLQDQPFLRVPLSRVVRHIPGSKFNPSGIAVDAQTGHLLIVAARQRALAEIDRRGRVVTAFTVPGASRHRQAEGIAVLPDGRLVLADEGGSKRARLALYNKIGQSQQEAP